MLVCAENQMKPRSTLCEPKAELPMLKRVVGLPLGFKRSQESVAVKAAPSA
jgi:hypothetical protein